MFVKKLVDMKEFKEVLASRGILLELITHPKGLEDFIIKTKFRLMYEDEDDLTN